MSLSTSNSGQSSSTLSKSYEGISLSSGATLGFYQLGALHAAESRGLLSSLRVYGGSSVGSIIALLLALGWSAVDIFAYCCGHDVGDVIKLYVDIQCIIDKWGLLDTKQLQSYIEAMILRKCDKVPTFLELYQQTKKVFVCTAYKLHSDQPKTCFSYFTHPNMSVLDAVMLSSNIPLIFAAKQYEDDYYVDGGVFCVNPAKYVAKLLQKTRGVSNTPTTPKVFSISLDYRSGVSGTNEKEATKIEENLSNDTRSFGMSDYIREIVFIPMHSQQHIVSNDVVDNIILKIDSAKVLNTSVNNVTKIKWFCSGMEQALQHFEKN
jgi:predicted acylesterase/phospholipase RssA